MRRHQQAPILRAVAQYPAAGRPRLIGQLTHNGIGIRIDDLQRHMDDIADK